MEKQFKRSVVYALLLEKGKFFYETIDNIFKIICYICDSF